MRSFDITEFGTSTAARTIIFVHGWPDTDAVFDGQYEAFAATHRIVTLSLPGYRQGSAPTPFFGFSVTATLGMLQAGIERAMKGRDEKPFVVAHDWGAHYVFMLERKHPELFDRIVGLDIAGHVNAKEAGLRGIAFILAYQWTLATLFLLPGFIGSPITRLLASFFFKAPGAAVAHSGMNYPYLRQWVGLATGEVPSKPRFQAPTVPVLFMYGTRKPVLFQSSRWIKHLEATDGSGVRVYDAGHWFFVGRNKNAVNDEIKAFIQ
jgi:pimeloyl-ACP methyl ester carboxylesterase